MYELIKMWLFVRNIFALFSISQIGLVFMPLLNRHEIIKSKGLNVKFILPLYITGTRITKSDP